jgi:methyltransferase (TIGR00027 family)
MTLYAKEQWSVEFRPSETAMGAATLRALAAKDRREGIRGPDWLAERFLSEERQNALQEPAMREWIIRKRTAPGMYEFMIARTAFFDDIVEKVLRENIPQLVFLGAGYDSRSYRFRDLIRETRIFEMDIETTQKSKKELLLRAGAVIPPQVTFTAINFTTDHIGDVLKRAGFLCDERTLFVWEGVTYYLPAHVVDDTLRAVKSCSAAGSMICFDYAARSQELSLDERVKKVRDSMKTNYPGEPTQFGINSGEIVPYLSASGYRVVAHIDAKDMERHYLTLDDGSLAGEVPAMFCFVLAAAV